MFSSVSEKTVFSLQKNTRFSSKSKYAAYSVSFFIDVAPSSEKVKHSFSSSIFVSSVSRENFFMNFVNSSSRHNGKSLSFTTPVYAMSDISIPISTSLFMVARNFDIYADSFPAVSFSFTDFEREAIFSSLKTPSRSSYFDMRESAVFSPIPRTPGILSEESPISAFTSTN